MSIQFVCEKCGFNCTMPDDSAGTMCSCPNCLVDLQVPEKSNSQVEGDRNEHTRRAHEESEELTLLPLDDEPERPYSRATVSNRSSEKKQDDYGIKMPTDAPSPPTAAMPDLGDIPDTAPSLSLLDDAFSDTGAGGDVVAAIDVPEVSKMQISDAINFISTFGLRRIASIIVLIVLGICTIYLSSHGHSVLVKICAIVGLLTAFSLLFLERPKFIDYLAKSLMAHEAAVYSYSITAIIIIRVMQKQPLFSDPTKPFFWIMTFVSLLAAGAMISIPILWAIHKFGKNFGYSWALTIVYALVQFGAISWSINHGDASEPVAASRFTDFKDQKAVVATKHEPETLTNTVKLSKIDLNDGRKLHVLLPDGEYTEHSLPCILVGPAGSNLVSGLSISSEDVSEQLPYARAGFAVIAFEIDGELPDYDDLTAEEAFFAYKQFRDAEAGLKNAQQAFVYARDKMPEVDPKQIYIAGHSSAGTLALLYAEHQNELAGCIAYAPQCDVEKHLKPMEQFFGKEIIAFSKKTSPLSFVEYLKCPTFLFYAKDDDVIDPDDIEKFKSLVVLNNPNVTIKTIADGGHYYPMVQKGIPAGIDWLKSIGAQPLDVSKLSTNEKEGVSVSSVNSVAAKPTQTNWNHSSTTSNNTIDSNPEPIRRPVAVDRPAPFDPSIRPTKLVVNTIDDYMMQVYLDRLEDNGKRLKSDGLLWSVAQRQPTIGTRWGIGVIWESRDPAPRIESWSKFLPYCRMLSRLPAELGMKIFKHKFGDWPRYGSANPNKPTFLGIGTASELAQLAIKEKVNAVIVFIVGRKTEVHGMESYAMRIRLIDPSGTIPEWTSDEFTNQLNVQGMRESENLTKATMQKIEQLYQPQPMPNITTAQAAARVNSFTWRGKTREEALLQLVELQYYRVNELINDAAARGVLESAVDGSFADAFLDANPAVRVRAIMERMKIGP